MISECVLCDWVYDPLGVPLAAYLIGDWLPLRWYPDGPGPVTGHATVTPQSTASVATAAHWAEAHPHQLELALGEGFEVRLLGTPPPPPPPVDTIYGVDLGSDDDSVTVVKASKVFIAKLYGAEVPEDSTQWVDIGGLVSPLEFRYKHGYDE